MTITQNADCSDSLQLKAQVPNMTPIQFDSRTITIDKVKNYEMIFDHIKKQDCPVMACLLKALDC